MDHCLVRIFYTLERPSLFGRKEQKNKEDNSYNETTPPETPYIRPNLYPSLNPEDDTSKISLPYVLVPEGVEVTSDIDIRPLKAKGENGDPLQSVPVTLVVDLESVNLGSLDSDFRNFSSLLLSILETDKRQDYNYDFSLERRILKEEQQINAMSE
nr:PREDICTED: uncharacterized protein LOC109040557 [Bemisia tabaci]